jgi:hypothetical protein
MNNLYFDNKDKVYYFNDLNKDCDNCSNIIKDNIVIRVFWDKLGSGVNYLCTNCKKSLKYSTKATLTETYMAIIESDIPSKAIPIIFSKPTLSCVRNIMTCDAAALNLDDEREVDNTVYSNKAIMPINNYLIESEEEDISLKLEHEAMTDDELDKFFVDVKNSIPMIGYDEQKVLK